MGLNTAIATGDLDWQVSHDEQGQHFRWARAGEEFVAEWVGILMVRADRRGNVLALQPAAGADPDAVDRLARGGSLAFAGWLAGRPSLHAAAASMNGAAVALIGAGGAGKSTLVAALCGLPGVHLLSDDVLLLERSPAGWLAKPTESTCRLEGGVSGLKQRTAVAGVSASSVPLRAVVDLRFVDTEAVELRELRGGEAFARVASALLRFEATPERWGRELERLVEIGTHVRICELSRPRNLEQVPAAAQCIIDHVFGGVE